MTNIDIKSIEQKLIDSAIRVVKSGEGCLYVIKLGELDHEPMIINDLPEPFSIFEDFYQKRLDILAKLDGACIIDKDGMLIAHSIKINNTKSFSGFGCRHSAAYTASLKGNTAILGSQENKKVKIFREGKMIMQIDVLEKDIEKKTGEAVNILESIGIGALSTLGAGMLIPAAGVALLPGILIFGSSHFLVKSLLNRGEHHG